MESLTSGSAAPAGIHSRTVERKSGAGDVFQHGEGGAAAVGDHFPIPDTEVGVGVGVGESRGLREGMGEGVEVEAEDFGEGRIGGHLADADRIERGVEVGERGIDVEALGSGGGFGGGAETGGAADEVGALGRLPDGEEAAGAGAGHGAVVAVGDGAQGLVDVLDEFGEVEGELAGGFGGAGIDNDDGVGGDLCGERGIARFVLRFVAVEPVDDGVAGGRAMRRRRAEGRRGRRARRPSPGCDG